MPLQINFLFPVLRLCRFSGSNKTSIIPYSFITLQLFLNTLYFKGSQIDLLQALAYMSQSVQLCLQSLVRNLKDGYKSLFQINHDLYGGAKVDNAFKSVNRMAEGSRLSWCIMDFFTTFQTYCPKLNIFSIWQSAILSVANLCSLVDMSSVILRYISSFV